MKYYSDYVTHLICGSNPEETDISDANEVYEIPAVTIKWVLVSAHVRKLVSTKPYLFAGPKLFTDIVMCLSKLGEDRDIIWALVTYHGGLVQLNLDNNCTHLVTVQTETPKYEKAVMMQIIVITPDWIMECVQSKLLVSPDVFHPRLVVWPKVVKHESTTAITGFDEQVEGTEVQDSAATESTQALLDKLKHALPWNQPQQPATVAKTMEVVPPNVIAPSYTAAQMKQKLFNQQLVSILFFLVIS